MVRRFVMILLATGVVAGYGSAIAHAVYGGDWHPHCAESTAK